MGLSRSDTTGVPGTQDSIGAFTTTNTASVFGTYPAGTTSLYQSNSSSAQLVLPSGSTVLYAELIWGGSYINGNVNLSAAINNPVSFITPAGTSSITPDSATAVQRAGGRCEPDGRLPGTSVVPDGIGSVSTTFVTAATMVVK
ncbi:hypothetical protein MKX74_22950 [Paenibacillus sp. FSL K6-1230]|uniref:hypothetical protein n=1 Tax=Paenibacillus sp. FSL K6-1230 TaxID=2921603 RepID=UPI0030F755CF